MSLNEFDLINRFFKQTSNRSDVVIGIGDDCAVVEPPPDKNIVVSVDTLTEKIHFPENIPPDALGYKSIAISLSDLAAMGATPAWVLLAITLPKVDEKWLTLFSRGLFEIIAEYQLALIGGNISKGPLSITTQVLGYAPKSGVLTRNGAQPDDLIFVTGTLGDAALGLKILQDESAHQDAYLLSRFLRPTPRVRFGEAIRDIATSAIDVSDGLAADLSHILMQSRVGASIYTACLPLSKELANLYETALTGGEDYELCFTLPEKNQQKLDRVIKESGIPVTCIGKIELEQGLRIYGNDGNLFNINKLGYQHF